MYEIVSPDVLSLDVFLYYSSYVNKDLYFIKHAICERIAYRSFQWFPNCTHALFESIRKISRWIHTVNLRALQLHLRRK